MRGLPKLKIRFTPARVLVIGFASLILIGALLLSLPFASRDGDYLRFVDALFTATSAVCVTGLVVVDTGTNFSKFGQFLIIALIQIGALGFMTFSTLVAMIFGKKIGLKERILIQESFNQFTMAGLVKLIRNVLLLTLAFEFFGGLILSARFIFEYPIERALAFGFFHSVSAFCNAGFDLFGQVYGEFAGITNYVGDWTVSLTIGSLIVISGLGFPVLMELYKYRQARRLSLHTKLVLRMTIVLILVGTILIFLLEMTNLKTIAGLNWGGKFLAALFQSITTRTAGFNTLDISQLKLGTWFIMIILMFIGASPSSTGGGVKTTTIGVLLAVVAATISSREDAVILERRIAKDLIYKALTIITLALSWVTLATLIMSLLEPQPFMNLLFEVVSAFGTVGLTTGITSFLSDISRFLIIVTMFIGRLGPLTIMVALAQAKQNTATQYIEDRVIIG